MHFGIFIAALVFIFGFRMIYVAARTAFSGKVLVRQGLRTHWQTAPNALQVALRDALMGLLLLVLAVFMMI